jgi:hypothetical protein
MHDEWWVSLDEKDRVNVGTRGIPRGQGEQRLRPTDFQADLNPQAMPASPELSDQAAEPFFSGFMNSPLRAPVRSPRTKVLKLPPSERLSLRQYAGSRERFVAAEHGSGGHRSDIWVRMSFDLCPNLGCSSAERGFGTFGTRSQAIVCVPSLSDVLCRGCTFRVASETAVYKTTAAPSRHSPEIVAPYC